MKCKLWYYLFYLFSPYHVMDQEDKTGEGIVHLEELKNQTKKAFYLQTEVYLLSH